MTSLSDRVEAATADQQAEMLIEAFDLLEWRSRTKRGGFVEHNPRWFKFDRMIMAEAYESAALMLLPETDASTAVFWRVGNDGEGADPALFKAQVLVATLFTSKSYTAVSDGPALALTAASLRARGL